jgi:hypothetical protein
MRVRGQDMGLVHDDQTVSISTFAHAQAQEDQKKEYAWNKPSVRSGKKFHTCLDAKNGTLLEKKFGERCNP